jgi:hypothetical protein
MRITRVIRAIKVIRANRAIRFLQLLAFNRKISVIRDFGLLDSQHALDCMCNLINARDLQHTLDRICTLISVPDLQHTLDRMSELHKRNNPSVLMPSLLRTTLRSTITVISL